jgi:hypothetical protein
VALGTLSVLLMGALVLAYVYRDELAPSPVERYRDYVPAGAQSVAVLNVERLRASVLYKPIEAATRRFPSDGLTAELRVLAIGPGDVSEAFGTSTEDGTDLFVLRTHRDVPLSELLDASVSAAVEVREGIQCMAVLDGSVAVHVAKTGPALFCLSLSQESLGAALRRVSGKDRSAVVHPLRRILHRVRRYDHCYVSVLGENAVWFSHPPDGLAAIGLAATLGSTVRGEVALEFAEAGQAVDYARKLEGDLEERLKALEQAITSLAESERTALDATRELLSNVRVSRQGVLLCAESSIAAEKVHQVAQLPPKGLLNAAEAMGLYVPEFRLSQRETGRRPTIRRPE